MIELRRNSSAAPSPELSVKVLGLGGAGSNALDRLLLDGMENAELIALNTDAQALSGSVASVKVQLGRTTTRGLGAGGDPEVGYVAAEESIDQIKSALQGAAMVFLIVGLGGGTGSGAAPLIASYARQMGAVVVVFATLPFSFEGKRRLAQAEMALTSLQEYSDVVVCFQNDQLGDLCDPQDGVQEAFGLADVTLSQSVRAIALLVQRPGILRVGLDELQTVLRAQDARCLFGVGEAEGDNRAHLALERALKCPLMDRGRVLEETRNVLVNVVGGPGMTLNEVQILMEELNRHISDRTRLLFGTSIDPRMGNRMSVMLLSAMGENRADVGPVTESVARPRSLPTPREVRPQVAAASIVTSAPVDEVAGQREEEEFEPSIPGVEENADEEAAAQPLYANSASAGEAVRAPRGGKQEQMTFEPVARGRFEKSEPTIVDGQDLDVPAFMRRNIRLK